MDEAKVDKTGDCWLWTGRTNPDGYGVLIINRRDTLVHRVSYLHHHGEIPKGFCVRHKCRNRHCVNPEHLEAGTIAQNNGEDRVRDGTDIRGVRNHRAKLTEDQVREIRRRIGQTQQSLADEFGVSSEQIGKVINGHRWKHIL